LADAAWNNRARTALPNGHCGLPRQHSCDHSNKCLTCPVFITTGADLPAHEEHRRRTLTLITQLEDRGQNRLADQNRAVLDHLQAASPRSTTTPRTSATRRAAMQAENSAHLRAAAARRHERTLQRARDALRQLEADGRPVTFDLVARTAGVSRAWLYTDPTIRDAVQRLRTAHRPTTNSAIPASQRASAPATRASCAGWKPRTPATANSPPRSASFARSSPAPTASSGQPG
jgi:hypothetical protein